MLTTIDLDAAILEATALAAEWEARFQAEFNEPLLLAQATQQFLAMPEAGRQELKQLDPRLYAELDGNVRRLLGRVGRAPVREELSNGTD